MTTTPPAISGNCFENCSIDKARLMVPKASINSYKSAAVWKTFGSIIDTEDGSANGTTIQVINGLKYIIYTDKNCATLINNNYTQSEITIPTKIVWQGRKYPVTELANGCFKNCNFLSKVTIPSSVKSIGEECFYYCSSLKSINIPASVIS